MMIAFRSIRFALPALLSAAVIVSAPAAAQQPQKPANQKPNKRYYDESSMYARW
jgi:hypothetical protein